MRLLFILVFSFLLLSCSKPEPFYHTQSFVFGTSVSISFYGEPEEDATVLASEIIRDFQELHNRLHAWRPSELSALNHAFRKGNLPVSIKPDLAAIIADATALSIQSKGTFNPAAGNLMNAWGFHQDEITAAKIKKNKIKNLVKSNPLMVDIVVKDGKVSSRNTHVRLDLDAYVKGYALDKALIYLRQHGVKNALISIGGSAIAIGRRGEEPWRVHIQHPRKPNAIATLELESGWAVSTIGDSQRYFEIDNQRYNNIINPVTGYPVMDVQSVTVLMPPQTNAGVLSDVAAKPIFIADPALRSQTAKEMGIENFLVIQSDHDIFISPSMSQYIHWTEPDTAQYVQQIQP